MLPSPWTLSVPRMPRSALAVCHAATVGRGPEQCSVSIPSNVMPRGLSGAEGHVWNNSTAPRMQLRNSAAEKDTFEAK